MTDKERQIQILLAGNPLKFACEVLCVKDMSNNKYSEVFNVSKEEIYEYARNKGLPQDYSTSRNSVVDGFHFYEDDGKWYSCFMERGIISDEHVFDDHDKGLNYIIETLLKLSGTGIY